MLVAPEPSDPRYIPVYIVDIHRGVALPNGLGGGAPKI